VLHETHLAFLLPLLRSFDHKHLLISLILCDIRLIDSLFQHHPLHLLHGQLMILYVCLLKLLCGARIILA
jgi:hypothetical protein